MCGVADAGGKAAAGCERKSWQISCEGYRKPCVTSRGNNILAFCLVHGGDATSGG